MSLSKLMKRVAPVMAVAATLSLTMTSAFANIPDAASNISSSGAHLTGSTYTSEYQSSTGTYANETNPGFFVSTSGFPANASDKIWVPGSIVSQTSSETDLSGDVSGLKPGTTYYVAVGAYYNGKWDSHTTYHFTTAAAPAAPATSTTSTAPTGSTTSAQPANATNSATIGINAGSLALILPGSQTVFTGVTLNGNAQSVKSDLGTIQVIDGTGTGDGYHMTVTASEFVESAPTGGFAVGTTAKKMPNGSLTLASPTSVNPNGTNSPAPTIASGPPWVVDNNQAVTLISAGVQEGMGSYNVVFPSNAYALSITPATAYVDTVNYPSSPTPYSSTIQFNIVVGP